jgi:hypothetical protein
MGDQEVDERAKWIKRLSRRRLRIPPGEEIPIKGKDPRARRRLEKEEIRRALSSLDEEEEYGEEGLDEGEATPSEGDGTAGKENALGP